MQEYKVKCGGTELARVLKYYGFIDSTISLEFKIVCPFHNDINPSMIINLESGRYLCFACDMKGNAYTFVREMNPEVNELKAWAIYFSIINSNKVNKIDLTGRIKKPVDKKQSYDEAYDYYYGLSNTDWTSNNLDEDTNAIVEYMDDRGFNRKMLKECGAKLNYNISYPIIFPMLDNGEFKGWVCRTNSKKVEKVRKYLYNKGFSRIDTLVGTYGNSSTVIVVEGYMDRLKLVQILKCLGIKMDVVAILGWKMSNEQANKLKLSGVTHVISALDNDVCGKKGTIHLSTKFDVTRFCYLKGVKDPGDMDVVMFQRMYNKTIACSIHKW